jgi:hypothetical protein
MLLDNKVEILLVLTQLHPDIATIMRNFPANEPLSKNFLLGEIAATASVYRSNNNAVCRDK